MEPTIELAPSARARCRGCGRRIEKGECRLGERLPNPFSDKGPMTLWFHPRCAAYKRPAILLAALEPTTAELADAEDLRRLAESGVEHRRLPRIAGLERSPTGRARCRCCREMIARDAWRIPLVFYEEGRFEASGFVHLTCSKTYFETTDVIDRAAHFASALSAEQVEQARSALGPEA